MSEETKEVKRCKLDHSIPFKCEDHLEKLGCEMCIAVQTRSLLYCINVNTSNLVKILAPKSTEKITLDIGKMRNMNLKDLKG
jgi:hypothetical protein